MKFRYNFLLSALCGLAFTACSNIDDDERLIYVEPVTEMRNVLIEDFTGQKCPNCGNETLVYQEGCLICTHCGASRCG